MGSPSLLKEKVSRIMVTLHNKAGLHSRPVGAFARVAKSFMSTITVKHHDQEVDGKKQLSLLQLDAHQGAFLQIEAVGDDAAEATQALLDLIRNKFGEPE